MHNKKLFNRLKLSCCPLSNYDFACLKEVAVNLKEMLSESNIYIIAQRPILTFEKLYVDSNNHKNPKLRFQIKQNGNDNTLTCSFPFRQKSMNNLSLKQIALHFDVDYPYLGVVKK